MLPEGTPGKYILVALLKGRMAAQQSCATLEEMTALCERWEAEGFTVLVEEAKSERAARWANA